MLTDSAMISLSSFSSNLTTILTIFFPSCRLVNTNTEDSVIEIKVDGNDLDAVRQQVLELAPLMGFEVEKAEIIQKEEAPKPAEEIRENDISMCETTRSSMTHDMRDEIQ